MAEGTGQGTHVHNHEAEEQIYLSFVQMLEGTQRFGLACEFDGALRAFVVSTLAGHKDEAIGMWWAVVKRHITELREREKAEHTKGAH